MKPRRSKRLSGKQTRAIVALLTQPSMTAAAADAEISEVTLWRWQNTDPMFQRALRKARRHAVSQAIGTLQRAAGEAVAVLRQIATDPEKPPSARVTAARTILEMAMKAVELEDLELRIQVLEAAITRGTEKP